MTTRSTIPSPALLKTNSAKTFVAAVLWALGAITASRYVAQLFSFSIGSPATELLEGVLLFGGFYWISRNMVPQLRPLSGVGFVRRPTQAGEFVRGALLGWFVVLALLVPAMLNRGIHTTFDASTFAFRHLILGLILLLIHAIVTQLLFTGLPFRMLVLATGPVTATVLFALLAGALAYLALPGDTAFMLFAAFTSVLLSVSFLRTRALWLALGLQIGFSVSMGLLFGVRSAFGPEVSGPVQTALEGPRWIAGTSAGLETSLLAFPVLLVALIVLIRITRDYAWHYSYEPVDGAGHPVEIAPPAEHVRMEEQATSKPEPLVQILPIAPKAASSTDQ